MMRPPFWEVELNYRRKNHGYCFGARILVAASTIHRATLIAKEYIRHRENAKKIEVFGVRKSGITHTAE